LCCPNPSGLEGEEADSHLTASRFNSQLLMALSVEAEVCRGPAGKCAASYSF
jgi:hypothetical protein